MTCLLCLLIIDWFFVCLDLLFLKKMFGWFLLIWVVFIDLGGIGLLGLELNVKYEICEVMMVKSDSKNLNNFIL